MIELRLTFSASIQTILIPSVVNDVITLHYASCDYCNAPIRSEHIRQYANGRRFCSDRDRKIYHYHHIADA